MRPHNRAEIDKNKCAKSTNQFANGQKNTTLWQISSHEMYIVYIQNKHCFMCFIARPGCLYIYIYIPYIYIS